jgi:hypothetical protein
MSEYGICPKCENELKADAPQGMCPECLMREGLETIGADTVMEVETQEASPLDAESLGRDVALKELLPPDGVDEDGTPIAAKHSKEKLSLTLAP